MNAKNQSAAPAPALDRLAAIESVLVALADNAAGVEVAVRDALAGDDWQVAQAVLLALRNHTHPRWVGPVLDYLEREDEQDIYGLVEGIGYPAGKPGADLQLPEGVNDATLQVWMRRWRGKQAACLALAALAAQRDQWPAGELDRAMVLLARNATDMAEVCQVRAAAAQALRAFLPDDVAQRALETALDDEETCTRVEARKGLDALQGAA